MKKGILFFILFILPLIGLNAQTDDRKDDSILEGLILHRQYNEAIEYIEKQEETAFLLSKKAMCYKALEQYGSTLEILQKLIKEDSINVRYLSEAAECYTFLFEWKKSAETYEYLVYLDSNNVYFETQYANMLLKTSNYDKALVTYNAIYDKYELKSVLKYKAECFENMNMPDSAVHYYLKAWENNKYDTYSLANYINLKIKMGAIPEAIELSEAFIGKDSTNRIINRLNAIAYYSTNLFYEEAAKRFERCYRQGDNSIIVSKGLGMCYYTLGNAEKAYPHLTKNYQADSTNLNNLFPLAQVCNDLGKNEEAIKYFNKVLEILIPNQVVLYINYKGLAESYERNEQYEEAMTNYLLALQNSSEESRMKLYYTIATMCAEKSHNYKDAIYYYEIYCNILIYHKERRKKALKKPDYMKAELDGLDTKEINEEAIREEIQAEINALESKIVNLSEYIAELKNKWNKQLDKELEEESIYEFMEKQKADSVNSDSIKDKKKESLKVLLGRDSLIQISKQEITE